MPGRGAPPKDPAQRRRRNKEHREQLPARVVADRPLPPGTWHPAAIAWWQTWVGSPQAEKFDETDWDGLADLLRLEDAYHRLMDEGEPKYLALAVRMATELRLGQQLLGRTVADRQHLKWDLVRSEPEASADPNVQSMDKWRERAKKRAADGAR